MKKEHCCAIIGQHPLRFPWGFDEEADECRRMKLELAQHIMALRQRGVTEFQIACDPGVGLYSGEIIKEYLITYDYLTDKLECLDARIEELARNERYGERVCSLGCFIGIKPHMALSLSVEFGDFRRVEKAPNFAGFLGLVPREDSRGGAETALPSRKRATAICGGFW